MNKFNTEYYSLLIDKKIQLEQTLELDSYTQ